MEKHSKYFYQELDNAVEYLKNMNKEKTKLLKYM